MAKTTQQLTVPDDFPEFPEFENTTHSPIALSKEIQEYLNGHGVETRQQDRKLEDKHGMDHLFINVLVVPETEAGKWACMAVADTIDERISAKLSDGEQTGEYVISLGEL